MARVGNRLRLHRLWHALALAAFLAASSSRFVKIATFRVNDIRSLAGLPLTKVRIFCFGPELVAAVDRIDWTIPPEGAYLLTHSGDAGLQPQTRYELAPRKAEYLEPLSPRTDLEAVPSDHAYVIRVDLSGVPHPLERTAYLHGAPVLATECAAEIPAALETPAEGAVVTSELTVEGWCQERSTFACQTIRIFLDGEERSREVGRYPRTDVEAADWAGYRAIFHPRRKDDGPHTLHVQVLTEDGRHRTLGPVRFTWRVE